MKKYIPVVFVLLIMNSCKKDAVQSVTSELTGKWELSKAFGGWIGEINYPAGNGNTLTFTEKNFTKVNMNADSAITTQGNYLVYLANACDNNSTITFIDFITTEGNTEGQEISITNQELTITQSRCIADGVTTIYRKIQ